MERRLYVSRLLRVRVATRVRTPERERERKSPPSCSVIKLHQGEKSPLSETEYLTQGNTKKKKKPDSGTAQKKYLFLAVQKSFCETVAVVLVFLV